MSIGAACFVAGALKNLKLRDFSGPFDWVYGSNILDRLNIIENRFKNFFNIKDFKYIGKNQDNGKNIYKNIKTQLVYNHDFPNGKLKTSFPYISAKYNRRIKRVLDLFDDKKLKILLVYAELGNTGKTDEIATIINNINNKYEATIDLLYINNNPSIKLGKHTKLQRIRNNFLYAEYHYCNFPEETVQATSICQHLIKKAIK